MLHGKVSAEKMKNWWVYTPPWFILRKFRWLEIWKNVDIRKKASLCVCIYIYIYIYIKERERIDSLKNEEKGKKIYNVASLGWGMEEEEEEEEKKNTALNATHWTEDWGSLGLSRKRNVIVVARGCQTYSIY